VSRLSAVLVAAAVLALAPASVAAHSLLIASVPSADTVVAEAPAVTLRFNNRIEKKLSRVRLVSAHGDSQILPLRGEGPVDTLEAPLPRLAAGRYRIEWRVLSTDGHVVSGAFGFSVSP
jgi:methionine-rich copper-binding protein CopC